MIDCYGDVDTWFSQWCVIYYCPVLYCFLLFHVYMYVCVCVRVCVWITQLWPTLCNPATPWAVVHQAPLSMEFPGKNTGVGSYSLLQGESSWSRNRTQVFCTAGAFFYCLSTRKACVCVCVYIYICIYIYIYIYKIYLFIYLFINYPVFHSENPGSQPLLNPMVYLKLFKN